MLPPATEVAGNIDPDSCSCDILSLRISSIDWCWSKQSDVDQSAWSYQAPEEGERGMLRVKGLAAQEERDTAVDALFQASELAASVALLKPGFCSAASRAVWSRAADHSSARRVGARHGESEGFGSA